MPKSTPDPLPPLLSDGHPYHYAQHRRGHRDAERILSHFDPLIGPDWARYYTRPGTKGAGYVQQVARHLSDSLNWYKSIGVYGLLHVQGLVTVGHNPFPDRWLPDGASRDKYEDRPAGATGLARRLGA